MRISEAKRSLLEMILTPVVRYFVRKNYTIQTFYDIAKAVFVAVAIEELEREEGKVNVSRLSAMTGVTRNEVTRIYKRQELPSVRTGMSIPARVMGQWELDARFCTKARKPRVLSCSGEDNEFYALVESVSKTLNPSTVMKELERIGAVEKTSRGVRLVKDIDRSEDEDPWRIELAAQDMDVLLQAVEENMQHPEVTRNLHIHTEADNILASALPKIREWVLAEGKRHHKRIRDYISKFDADVRPELVGDERGKKVVFSTFSYTSLPEADE